MSLVPRPLYPPMELLTQTVTIAVTDLYDLLTRKETPMPELTRATTVSRTKRGYRRISMTLKLAEWEIIARMAEVEDRTPDQQALHMLRRLIAQNITLDERLTENGEVGGAGNPEDAVDPHGLTLGSVTRTE
jgi:hypothetical protein